MLIDGLQCGHFDRAAFTALRQGNVGAVTITGGFWEDVTESLDSNLAIDSLSQIQVPEFKGNGVTEEIQTTLIHLERILKVIILF